MLHRIPPQTQRHQRIHMSHQHHWTALFHELSPPSILFRFALAILNVLFIRFTSKHIPRQTMTAASILKRFRHQVFPEAETQRTSSTDCRAIGSGRVKPRIIGVISLMSHSYMETILSIGWKLRTHPRRNRCLPFHLLLHKLGNWKTH